MPFYEYECANCRFYVEVLQKISEQPLKKCPSCGKNALKKLVSAPVFRLKGSGWYETDFKSDQEGKRNLAGADKDESAPDKKADTKSDAAGDSKSGDTKTESKADAKTDKTESKTAAVTTGKSEPGSARRKSKPVAAKPKPKASKRPAAKSKSSAKRRRGR